MEVIFKTLLKHKQDLMKVYYSCGAFMMGFILSIFANGGVHLLQSYWLAKTTVLIFLMVSIVVLVVKMTDEDEEELE